MSNLKVTHLANALQLCIAKRQHLPGKAVHAQILVAGLSGDTFLSNRLIEVYTRCRHLDHAIAVFRSILQPNVFSWNVVISACSKFVESELARHLFVRMPDKNVFSWNTMISTLSRNRAECEALGLYYMMIREGCTSTNFAFASVLSACGGLTALEDGRRCHALAVKTDLDDNLFVENALLGMYAKCGSTEDAIKVFDRMVQPNEVSFTAMMGGLMLSGSGVEAVRLFAKMHKSGINIDQIVVSSVLGACAGAGNEEWRNVWCHGLMLGQSVQALLYKYAFESYPHVGNSLIDMYAKLGSMDEAEMVFNSLPSINVVSWNVLIAGYSQKGDGRKAIELMEFMQKSGFEPDV